MAQQAVRLKDTSGTIPSSVSGGRFAASPGGMAAEAPNPNVIDWSTEEDGMYDSAEDAAYWAERWLADQKSLGLQLDPRVTPAAMVNYLVGEGYLAFDYSDLDWCDTRAEARDRPDLYGLKLASNLSDADLDAALLAKGMTPALRWTARVHDVDEAYDAAHDGLARPFDGYAVEADENLGRVSNPKDMNEMLMVYADERGWGDWSDHFDHEEAQRLLGRMLNEVVEERFASTLRVDTDGHLVTVHSMSRTEAEEYEEQVRDLIALNFSWAEFFERCGVEATVSL